jgi:hypothetical protein
LTHQNGPWATSVLFQKFATQNTTVILNKVKDLRLFLVISLCDAQFSGTLANPVC